MNQSNFLSLGVRDFLRGLAIAVIAPVILVIQQSLELGELVFNWKLIATTAISAGLAYVVKNLFTSPDSAKIGGGGIKNPPTN